MSQFPAMPLWVSDFYSKTFHLTREERSCYLDILMKTWVRNCQPFTDDAKEMALVVGVTVKRWLTLRPKLVPFFDLSDGTWRQPRLEDERTRVANHQGNLSRRGKRGAEAKWRKNNDITLQRPSPKQCLDDGTHTHIEDSSLRSESDSASNEAPAFELGEPSKRVASAREVSDRMFEIWNEVCGHINKPIKLEQDRRIKLIARLKDSFDSDIEKWRAYCERIAASPYLRGEVRDFRVYFDWVLKPLNLRKVVEGNYDPRNQPGEQPVVAAHDPDEEWRMWLTYFRDGWALKNKPPGFWLLNANGPPPGDPDCRVPARLLREFGYEPHAPRSAVG